MREAVFILAVILVLLILTAVRYRRQIVGMLTMARALKHARENAAGFRPRREVETATQLLQCSKCGVWVPRGKALRHSETFLCTDCR